MRFREKSVNEMEKEVLRLFKGYLDNVNQFSEMDSGGGYSYKDDIKLSNKGITYGILIPESAGEKVINEAIKQYGKTGEDWNQTLHKDFEIVKNAPIEDLIAQQTLHYLTTYGFESLGFFDSDKVYIPNGKLEVPGLDINSGVEFITIKPITASNLTNKLMTLLTSGIALSKQTIEDIMVLSDFVDKNRLDEISNREVKIALYDKYNITPKNPEEFLRFLIFKTIGETLKIQSKTEINMIKHCNKNEALKLFKSYLNNVDNGYIKLSSIFLRNKNLFLAFKEEGHIELNHIINKLRKLAVKNHRPLKKNILDCLTDNNIDINPQDLETELDNCTVFREIRIVNGILYRLYGDENILYRIRNGKSYVKKVDNTDYEYHKRLDSLFNIVYKHLVNRISEKVKDKYIYIPNNITYAAPSSEKQFNGNIPEGSYLELPRENDLVYGVHWNNIIRDEKDNEERFYGELSRSNRNEERVDLDLKQMNNSEIFGWDASFRSENRDILFSGDMTDAPNPKGATELFYVNKNYNHGAFLITLNMFTGNSKDVPFEFVIAKDQGKKDVRRNYVLDPNNILEKVNMEIKTSMRQMVVGFITISDKIRFYFSDFGVGAANSITSTNDDVNMGVFKYLQSYSKCQLRLNDLLKDAGAIVIDEPTHIEKVVQKTIIRGGDYNDILSEKESIVEIEKPADIDLSINAITKETLIDLLG